MPTNPPSDGLAAVRSAATASTARHRFTAPTHDPAAQKAERGPGKRQGRGPGATRLERTVTAGSHL